jgi:hypothetical protein
MRALPGCAEVLMRSHLDADADGGEAGLRLDVSFGCTKPFSQGPVICVRLKRSSPTQRGQPLSWGEMARRVWGFMGGGRNRQVA